MESELCADYAGVIVGGDEGVVSEEEHIFSFCLSE